MPRPSGASWSGSRELRGAAGRAEQERTASPRRDPWRGGAWAGRAHRRQRRRAPSYLGQQSPCSGGSLAAAGVEAGVVRVGAELAALGLARRAHTSPAEPLQPPWHYVISDATAYFRFDACPAFIPPPRALSSKNVVWLSPGSSTSI